MLWLNNGVDNMTQSEVTKLLYQYSMYWPLRPENTEHMAYGWYRILKDLPYAAAQAGLEQLAGTAKFPPTVAEIVEAAEPFNRKLLAAAGKETDWLRAAEKRFRAKIQRCKETGQKFSWEREY